MPPSTRLKARLIDSDNIIDNPDIPLGQSVFRIGRHPASDLVIPESTVSGRHAAIEFQQDQYVIVDQKSTNKTWVNGEELKPQKPYPLKNGDEIRFDAYCFTFELEEIKIPPPEAKPAPGPAVDLDDDATLIMEGEAIPGGGAGPDDDETVFFDSEALFTGEAGPAVSVDMPDDDETIFFDSKAMLEGEADPDGPVAETDDDETIFLDDDSKPVYDVKATFVRKEPAVALERTKIGNYYVSNLLGKGGFGSVWKGMTPDGEPVAIKVLNPDVIENERAVRKFFHEAIILSKMDHPNICRFFDFFPYEGNYAIVMDFVKGVELKSILEEQKGPLPMEQARKIAAQALDAFHYAHMKDILHRDIKPENISVDEEGTAKVMDFGIAKLSTSESQQTALFMISPQYTAPERFDANNTEAVDHRSGRNC